MGSREVLCAQASLYDILRQTNTIVLERSVREAFLQRLWYFSRNKSVLFWRGEGGRQAAGA